MPKGVKMEKYRPKIHFSAEDYIINDPNGLVYYKGEYHLFHQYNNGGTARLLHKKQGRAARS